MAAGKILILDFGSQYTQLIARRLRELHFLSEIVPFNISIKQIENLSPYGLILSGGPKSVYDKDALLPDKKIFSLGIPILGVCYGMQLIAYQINGKVVQSHHREYGESEIKLNNKSKLLHSLKSELKVWMSHADEVKKAPAGFSVTAHSGESISAMENPKKKLFAVQFHPEVAHTQQGKQILKTFAKEICQLKADWTPRSVINIKINEIQNLVGDDKAICALSGGIDSTVAATLVSKAIGKRQVCIFVDTGMLRKNEFEEVLNSYRKMNLNVKSIRAGKTFLSKLRNITDPEKKRKIIGAEFVKIFEKEAKKLTGTRFLVQGTLYPDVIESSIGQGVVIKSHHNVGGLPKKLNLELIEPLRELFKDEVRIVGKQLGLPKNIINRQPFPGPGLSVRILGPVTTHRVRILQEADKILEEEILKIRVRKNLWQFFAVLLPVSSVGVMGDGRTYQETIAIRAVESLDGMTARWAKLPDELLQKVSSRIVGEVRGINRVVYDITNKPPATIEWE